MTKLIPADQVALPSDLKRANRQNILKVLRTGRTMTAADIHAETGISRPTVMRALQHYCDLGVVRSLGLGSTTSMGGKKPELFVFAEDKRILCINLWPEMLTLALCGMVGDVYAAEHHQQKLGATVREAFAQLRERVQLYLHQLELPMNRLYGVVLTVPGTVDYDERILRYNSQAPGWGADAALDEELKTLFGDTPVYYIDNAGKAAGRAVLLDHPEYADQRMMTVFTTWGVSACMTERGHVLNGRDSLIGEIGHMIISDQGPVLCGCGKRGCLESLVSLPNAQRLMLENGAKKSPDTFRALFEASHAGDAAAQKTVRYLAHCFAVALHNLSLAYNQEAVIFQGDFAWADEVFDKALKSELSEFRYYPQGKLFDIGYDRRDLPLLAARGGAELLKKQYFASLD
ncbi:MAG: ROK family transcriptional regulator [bacterium]|nr:ROK family transcriptional regulator [bacterium]